MTVDAKAFGYPIRSLKEVPAGEYTVQAVLNLYETFHRADGSVVKLHMDQGEGQHWNETPGNLYSTPKKVKIGPGASSGSGSIAVAMTEVIPPIAEKPDTKYVRRIKIQTALLTKFWAGRCFYPRWC